jgi:hypothetical protein
MIGQYPYKLMASYPHMKPEDVAIWERFIKAFPDYFERCDYDVCVGEGRMPEGEHPENYLRGWQMLTQKKIDVVAYRGNEIWIIEVKPRARANALGQVWMYDELYKDMFEPETEPKNLIITDQYDRDTERVAQSGNVQIIVV